jgi:hypothetical protein
MGDLFYKLAVKIAPPVGTEEERRLSEQQDAELTEPLGRWRYLVYPPAYALAGLWLAVRLLLVLGLLAVAFPFRFAAAWARMPAGRSGVLFGLAVPIAGVVLLVLGDYLLGVAMFAFVVSMSALPRVVRLILAPALVAGGLANGFFQQSSVSDALAAILCSIAGITVGFEELTA